MKKLRVVTLLITIICVLMLSSCASVFSRWDRLYDNNDQIADATFVSLIDAIKSKDAAAIVGLFSQTVQSDDGLEIKANQLIDYIEGDILSYTSAAEAGVGANSEIQKGKERKEILSAFSITTTTNKYHIAIKECTRNDMDHNDIGVLSLYIIEQSKWTEDYIYGGDGKWTPGINIE